jgi:hypothetical protein
MHFKLKAYRLKWYPLLAVLLAAAVGGCIFEPRDSQPPEDDTGSSWVVPDSPTKVFVNMTSGLESLSGTNYEKSINAEFTFIPLPGDENQFPGKFTGWNKLKEMEVTNTIIGDAQTLVIEFSNLNPIQTSTSFAQYEGRYELSIVNKSDTATVVYKAKARFDLKEGSKGWELTRWEDFESVAGFASWGFLRGTLSN